jgi:hypothetical protein
MSTQLPPLVLQRRHWYAYGGPALAHVPGLAARVWPAWAVPEIVGGAVLTGQPDRAEHVRRAAADGVSERTASPATATSATTGMRRKKVIGGFLAAGAYRVSILTSAHGPTTFSPITPR